MKKESILKYIKGMPKVVPALVYGITCISVLLYLCGLPFTEDYWYFVLYALCFFCLAFYKYRNVEFYLRYRKRLCLLMGAVFCLIAYSVNANSRSNYLYFLSSEQALVIEEGSDWQDGYIDIYKKKVLFKLHLDTFKVEDGRGSLTVELNPLGGHVFKGADSYSIGLFDFNLEDENTLRVTHSWGNSMEITID